MSSNKRRKVIWNEGLISKQLKKRISVRIDVREKTGGRVWGVVTANEGHDSGTKRTRHGPYIRHHLDKVCCTHTVRLIFGEKSAASSYNVLETGVLGSIDLGGRNQHAAVRTTESSCCRPCCSIVEAQANTCSSRLRALAAAIHEHSNEFLDKIVEGTAHISRASLAAQRTWWVVGLEYISSSGMYLFSQTYFRGSILAADLSSDAALDLLPDCSEIGISEVSNQLSILRWPPRRWSSSSSWRSLPTINMPVDICVRAFHSWVSEHSCAGGTEKQSGKLHDGGMGELQLLKSIIEREKHDKQTLLRERMQKRSLQRRAINTILI